MPAGPEHISTSEANRSGAAITAARATRPPKEWPSRCTRGSQLPRRPRRTTSASRSGVYCGGVGGSGRLELPGQVDRRRPRSRPAPAARAAGRSPPCCRCSPGRAGRAWRPGHRSAGRRPDRRWSASSRSARRRPRAARSPVHAPSSGRPRGSRCRRGRRGSAPAEHRQGRSGRGGRSSGPAGRCRWTWAPRAARRAATARPSRRRGPSTVGTRDGVGLPAERGRVLRQGVGAPRRCGSGRRPRPSQTAVRGAHRGSTGSASCLACPSDAASTWSARRPGSSAATSWSADTGIEIGADPVPLDPVGVVRLVLSRRRPRQSGRAAATACRRRRTSHCCTARPRAGLADQRPGRPEHRAVDRAAGVVEGPAVVALLAVDRVDRRVRGEEEVAVADAERRRDRRTRRLSLSRVRVQRRCPVPESRAVSSSQLPRNRYTATVSPPSWTRRRRRGRCGCRTRSARRYARRARAPCAGRSVTTVPLGTRACRSRS